MHETLKDGSDTYIVSDPDLLKRMPIKEKIIKTKEITSSREFDIEINNFLKKEKITKQDLIDIKYSTIKYDNFQIDSRALIIYEGTNE